LTLLKLFPKLKLVEGSLTWFETTLFTTWLNDSQVFYSTLLIISYISSLLSSTSSVMLFDCSINSLALFKFIFALAYNCSASWIIWFAASSVGAFWASANNWFASSCLFYASSTKLLASSTNSLALFSSSYTFSVIWLTLLTKFTTLLVVSSSFGELLINELMFAHILLTLLFVFLWTALKVSQVLFSTLLTKLLTFC